MERYEGRIGREGDIEVEGMEEGKREEGGGVKGGRESGEDEENRKNSVECERRGVRGKNGETKGEMCMQVVGELG